MWVSKRDKDNTEIAYWRKENALHGWFEKNYQVENCGEVNLPEETINQLLEDLENHKLEPTTGLFYGTNEELDDEWFDTMIKQWKDIKQKLIESDIQFYYTCWY